VYKRHGGKNQKWKIVYVDQAEKEQQKGMHEFGFHVNRPFYFRSRLPMKRVAEALGANNIVIKRWRKNSPQQQFFFDAGTKTIRSNHWKNYAIEIQSNGGSSNVRLTSGITSRWW
jgi:adenine specific DNA methylase Mod